VIEIKMDSRGVHIQDLGIDGGGGGFDGDVRTGLDENGAFGLDRDEDSEEEEDDAAEEAAGVGANLVNEFGINKEQLCNELRHTPVDANSVRRTPITKHNIQQQGVLQQQAFRPVRQQNNLPPALNQRLMVPQVPQQQEQPIAPYQAHFAAAVVPVALRTTTSKCSFLAWKCRKWRNRSKSGVVLKGKNAWQSWSCKGLSGREDWRTKNGKRIEREMKKGKNELRRGEETMSSDDSPAKKKRRTKSDDSDSN
jgi:hypothetical protein